MRALTIYAALLPIWLTHASAIDTTDINVRGPGRANRMLSRAVPRDFGTFKVSCKDAEGACNNACYHIKCADNKNPDANKIIYVGPRGGPKTGGHTEADRNRIESGCTSENGNKDGNASGSVCRAFPFSQKWTTDDQSKQPTFQCDEWPPAASQQQPFGKKSAPNSLRCMPGSENAKLGARLGNFITGIGGPYPDRKLKVRMDRGDFFRVEFDLTGADTNKLKFCQGQGTINCGSDGRQFYMSEKPTKNGKMSTPYNPFKYGASVGTDNHYRLEHTVYPDLLQCKVKLTRNGDNDFEDIKLFNWKNNQVGGTQKKTIPGNTGTADFTGLPLTLHVNKQGNFNTKVGFTYGENENVQAAYFKWDSESVGDGKGPAWKDGKPERYCKVDTSGTKQAIECYFPCYEK